MSGSTAKQSQEETILRLLAANHSLQGEIAALREGIGLLTTLAPDVDCGLPITKLCWAIHKAVTAKKLLLECEVRELEHLNARRYRHCRDCCCAQTWEALGGRATDGGGIVERVTALREKNERQAAEIGLLRERVREVAEELSDSSVTFSDPRVSYEEIQLTAGWRKEWLSCPEVVRALEEEQ